MVIPAVNSWTTDAQERKRYFWTKKICIENRVSGYPDRFWASSTVNATDAEINQPLQNVAFKIGRLQPNCRTYPELDRFKIVVIKFQQQKLKAVCAQRSQ